MIILRIIHWSHYAYVVDFNEDGVSKIWIFYFLILSCVLNKPRFVLAAMQSLSILILLFLELLTIG